MNKLTRRRLFATIAAAFVAKPALKQLIRCECPGCQYARGFIRRGGYEFYPDALTVASAPLINPPNRLLTYQEVASDYLQILKDNTLVS